MLPSLLLLVASASAAHHSARHPRHTHQHVPRQESTLVTPNAPAGGFEIVGNSGVSAQMMFLGTSSTVYFLDKTENNPMRITNKQGIEHPAWGASYNLWSNQATPMEVTANTFCAGGFPVGNGSWVVFGGNQPVTLEGVAVNDKVLNPTGANPYTNADGGDAIRLINPCDGNTCEWQEGGAELTMAAKRWYPTIEGLGDGRVVVLGGDHNGGYVSTKIQNEPSYEYWPKEESGAIRMDFLDVTVPVNLFPLTFLMPSGKLFLQAAYKSILYDLDARQEIPLPDMPYAQRVYPASAAAVMLPLTPANNYHAEVLFCGGSAADISKSTDVGAGFNVTAVPADKTCVRISPDDENPTYKDDDDLPEARVMGQLIYLPDGTLWLGNGVGMGTAGYGDEKYSVGQSYGQDPVYMPAIYDPSAPAGSRFNRDGLSASTEERMYHSTAILLSDGAILVSGSNPNKDVTDVQWGTKYSVEKWYPKWYNEPRPVPSSLPWMLSYGGGFWNTTITDRKVDPSKIKVTVVRTGFSTHGMNFGQRYLELATSFSKVEETGEITVFVSQMPPNANLFTPGPAMLFLVVDGIPSVGQMITVGNGQIGAQPVYETTVLPQSEVIAKEEQQQEQQPPPAQAQVPTAPNGGNSGVEAVANNQQLGSGASALVGSVFAVVAGVMGSLLI